MVQERQQTRRRKSAAERRAQRLRSEVRLVAKLLRGFADLQAHRGGQPTRLCRALGAALASSAEEQEAEQPEQHEIEQQETEQRLDGDGVLDCGAQEVPRQAVAERRMAEIDQFLAVWATSVNVPPGLEDVIKSLQEEKEGLAGQVDEGRLAKEAADVKAAHLAKVARMQAAEAAAEAAEEAAAASQLRVVQAQLADLAQPNAQKATELDRLQVLQMEQEEQLKLQRGRATAMAGRDDEGFDADALLLDLLKQHGSPEDGKWPRIEKSFNANAPEVKSRQWLKSRAKKLLSSASAG